MAVENGVRLTYAKIPKSTKEIMTEEFWGKDAPAKSQEFLKKVTDGKTGDHYHYFESITRGEA